VPVCTLDAFRERESPLLLKNKYVLFGALTLVFNRFHNCFVGGCFIKTEGGELEPRITHVGILEQVVYFVKACYNHRSNRSANELLAQPK